ncbi:MAG: hypothetical protein NZ585_13930 [Chloracidobacterium sp.]|nr:hypothetical protein [Chloracidobacterium sp.]MDW8217946.1 hypothetical protein [Acidobacteriota bacterium]
MTPRPGSERAKPAPPKAPAPGTVRKVAYGIEVVYIPASAFCMGASVEEVG